MLRYVVENNKNMLYSLPIMISVEEMTHLEEETRRKGVSALKLMENAGKKVAQALGTNILGKKVAIFCGHGNNGGDGFVTARYLAFHCKVTVLFVGNEDRFKTEARINFESIRSNKRIKIVTTPEDLDNQYDFVIDAMVGTGLDGPLDENLKKAIMKYNLIEGKKICVDIPTGVNPDTGEVSELSCNYDIIITFHDIKQGLEKMKDKVLIADIGIKT